MARSAGGDTVYVTVRCSAEETAQLDAKAKLRGLNRSDYIRSMLGLRLGYSHAGRPKGQAAV